MPADDHGDHDRSPHEGQHAAQRYTLTLGQRWVATAGRDAEFALPIQRLYRIDGDLDTRRLLSALRAVLRENEALRLRLHGAEGSWQQSFPERDLAIDAVAPTGGSPARRLDWALGYLAQAASTVLDLDGAGAFRAHLVRLDPGSHILGLTVDHLAVDAVGFGLLEDRLWAAYRGHARLSPSGQFQAYLATHHTSEAERDRALAYWLGLLQDLPGTPAPGGRVLGQRACLTWQGRPLSECLDACQRARWSPFTALLAAQALLMAHLSGTAQVVVNTPFSNRVTDEEKSLLANLAILVYLPIAVLPDEPLARFRDRLKRFVLASMAHRNHDPWQLSTELARAAGGTWQGPSLVAGCNFLRSPATRGLGQPMSLDAVLPFSLRPGTLIVTCEQSDQRFDLEVLWDPERWPLTDGSELFSAFQQVTCADGARRVSELLAGPLPAAR